jgi:hypothetical protein
MEQQEAVTVAKAFVEFWNSESKIDLDWPSV